MRALEAVAARAAAGIEPQMRREAGAILARPQRAQVAGERLGQHRQHAVREIDRVAALRAPRDRADRPAAHSARRRRSRPRRASRAAVARRPHRIVEVARIRPVDRDQRQIAQIVAALAGRDRPGGLGLALRRRRERHRQIVAVRGEQRDGARIARLAQPLGDPAVAGPERLRRQPLDDHQLAGLGTQAVGRPHAQLRLRRDCRPAARAGRRGRARPRRRSGPAGPAGPA